MKFNFFSQVIFLLVGFSSYGMNDPFARFQEKGRFCCEDDLTSVLMYRFSFGIHEIHEQIIIPTQEVAYFTPILEQEILDSHDIEIEDEMLIESSKSDSESLEAKSSDQELGIQEIHPKFPSSKSPIIFSMLYCAFKNLGGISFGPEKTTINFENLKAGIKKIYGLSTKPKKTKDPEAQKKSLAAWFKIKGGSHGNAVLELVSVPEKESAFERVLREVERFIKKTSFKRR